MVAQEAGLNRESLYKSFAAESNTEFATVLMLPDPGFRPLSRPG